MPGFYTDGPITSDPGSITDYPASPGEAFGAALNSFEVNPTAYLGRGAAYLDEDWAAMSDPSLLVSKADAEAEVRKRGLDIKIPDGGITRLELNSLQYLKQREISRGVVAARSRGFLGGLATFAGGLAAQATDPINIASAFIPFVPEARYEAMLAQAGTSTFARAATRVGLGAFEGAAGAAVVEPINYIGATHEQADYSLENSFLNIVFGGLIGGGLHAVGGAWHDARVSSVLRSLDEGLHTLALRDVAERAPEDVRLQALQQAVQSIEHGEPVRVDNVFADHAIDLAKNGEEVHPDWEVKLDAEGHGTFTERMVSVGNTIRPIDPTADGFRPISKTLVDGKEVLYGVDKKGNVVAYVKAKDQAFFEHGMTERPQPDPKLDDFQNAREQQKYPRNEDEYRVVGTIRRASDKQGEPMGAAKDMAVAPYLEGRGVEGEMVRIAEGEGVDLTGVGERRADPTAVPDRVADHAADSEEFAVRELDNQSRAAGEILKKAEAAGEQTPEDVAADQEYATAHLDSMRERGLVPAEVEAALKAADEEAAHLEEEAKGYEAAGACDAEDTDL